MELVKLLLANVSSVNCLHLLSIKLTVISWIALFLFLDFPVRLLSSGDWN